MEKMECAVCGGPVCTSKEAIREVGASFPNPDPAYIVVMHIDCAISDGRIDSYDDVEAPFYWEL